MDVAAADRVLRAARLVAEDEATLRSGVGAIRDLPVGRDAHTLVLGDEEYLYVPQRIAASLGDSVRTSSSTRSPVLTLDRAGYPIRTVIHGRSTTDPTQPAFAYNVAPSTIGDAGNAPGFDDIVFVTEHQGSSAAASELVAALKAAARRSVHVVSVVSGPAPVLHRENAVEPAGNRGG